MNKKRVGLIISVLLILTTGGYIQFKISELNNKLNQANKKHEELVIKQNQLLEKQEIILKDNEELKSKNKQLEEDILNAQQQLNKSETEKENLRSLVEEQKGKITILEKNVKTLKEQSVKKESAKTVSRGSNIAGKEFYVNSTAYTAYCNGCSGKTATGINLRTNPNAKVIAVDPRVIPLGTKVWVEGYGYAVAADKGSAIKGNKIDVFIPTKQEAYQWGRRTVKIKILN